MKRIKIEVGDANRLMLNGWDLDIALIIMNVTDDPPPPPEPHIHIAVSIILKNFIVEGSTICC